MLSGKYIYININIHLCILYRLFAWLAASIGSGLSSCLEWIRGTRRDEEEPAQLEQQRLPHLDPVCTIH